MSPAEPSPYPLGRVVSHDDRSRAYSLAERTGTALPTQAVRWERHGPVFDQSDLGCCTACAALGVMMTGRYFNGTVYTLEDAHSFYHDETVVDDVRGTWPPTDTGSSGLAAMKVLKQRGLIAGYLHAFTPEAAVAALAMGPIAVGTPWLESMFTPKRGRIGVDKRSAVAGGHEYVIDGWDPKTRKVHMTNSWGTGWGVDGGALLSFTDLAWLLGQQGDAVQPSLTATT